MGKEKKSKPYIVSKRRWLNKKKHHSIGLTFIDGYDIKGQYPNLNLTIGDCSRTVTLDFTEGGKPTDESIANGYYKLEALRDTLDDVEEYLGMIEVALNKRKKEEAKKNKD